jgi:hypothetical protein
MKLLREYIRELLKEDPMGFVQDLAAASDQFGEEGQEFHGGNPGKSGGKAIKRAFAANADYNFLDSLDTVHWTGDTYNLATLVGRSRDELSTTMTLPGESFSSPKPALELGLWIKGRITLAANNQDDLYTGTYFDYMRGSDPEQFEKDKQRKASSGVNKRPTVSKDYSRYGKLKKGNEYHEKMARKIPYVLDQSTWNPTSVNEALVDNWQAKGLIVVPQDIVKIIKDNPGGGGMGWLKKAYEMAEAFDVPMYDTDRNVIWSPQ